MRIIVRLASAFLIAISSTAPAFAQAAILVWISPEQFFFPQSGIPALSEANQMLEREFAMKAAELNRLNDQMIPFVNQIKDAQNAGNTALATKLTSDRDRLTQVFVAKENELRAQIQRRRESLLAPLVPKVTATFPAYAAERKFDVIAESTSSMLYVSTTLPKETDVTADFIKWYNARAVAR